MPTISLIAQHDSPEDFEPFLENLKNEVVPLLKKEHGLIQAELVRSGDARLTGFFNFPENHDPAFSFAKVFSVSSTPLDSTKWAESTHTTIATA